MQVYKKYTGNSDIILLITDEYLDSIVAKLGYQLQPVSACAETITSADNAPLKELQLKLMAFRNSLYHPDDGFINPLSPGGSFMVQKMDITSPIPVF